MQSSTGNEQADVDLRDAPASAIPAHAAAALRASGLRSLSLRGVTLLPIVQGGMGVGVSAHRLAGSVAAEGGIGTISAIDLRRLHPDLMDRTRGRGVGPEVKAEIERANLEALAREIAGARRLAGGHGRIAVNVMRAVSQYAPYVRHAI
ncbi:MAG: nitronate monooxygenase, partial [Burkholderiaceae bacterium]